MAGPFDKPKPGRVERHKHSLPPSGDAGACKGADLSQAFPRRFHRYGSLPSPYVCLIAPTALGSLRILTMHIWLAISSFGLDTPPPWSRRSRQKKNKPQNHRTTTSHASIVPASLGIRISPARFPMNQSILAFCRILPCRQACANRGTGSLAYHPDVCVFHARWCGGGSYAESRAPALMANVTISIPNSTGRLYTKLPFLHFFSVSPVVVVNMTHSQFSTLIRCGSLHL